MHDGNAAIPPERPAASAFSAPRRSRHPARSGAAGAPRPAARRPRPVAARSAEIRDRCRKSTARPWCAPSCPTGRLASPRFGATDEGVGVDDAGGFRGGVVRFHHRLTDGPPTRGRRILVWCLVVLAMILVIACSLTIWVQRQALDTDNWVDLSTELLQDDEVRALVADRLVDELYAKTNVEGSIERALPPRLEGLAAPAAGLVRQAATDAADALLQRPAIQQLWAEINRRAHSQLVAILRDEQATRGALTAREGEVVLNLRPLVEQLAQQLGLSVALPPTTGVYVLANSDQLSAAQTAVQAIDALSILAIIAVVVLLVVAVYLASGFRRQTLRGIGAGLIFIGVLLLVVSKLVGNAIVDDLTSDATRSTGWAVWVLGTSLFRDICLALVAYGLVLVIGAWLAGPSRPARWLRRTAAPTLRERPLVAYGAVALIFLLVLLWGPTGATRSFVGVIVLAVLTGIGVYFLRRQTLKEFPPASSG